MRKLRILKRVFAIKKLFLLILLPMLATSFFFLGTQLVQGTQHYPNCLHFDMTFNATGWNSSTMGTGMDIGCAGDYGADGCRGGVARIRPGERLELRRCTCAPYGDPRYSGRGCLVIGRDLAMEDYSVSGTTRRRVVRGPGTDLPSYCRLVVKGTSYTNTDFFPTAGQYDANPAAGFCGPNGTERDKSFSVICTPPVTNTPIPPPPTATPRPPTIPPTVPPTSTPIPTSTPTPTPAVTYSISGGIFIDDDGDSTQEATDGNGRKDTGEDFFSGTLNIAGPSLNANITSGATGFTRTSLPAGQYTVSYPVANIPAGHTATYPVNTPPPRTTVTVGTACTVNPATGGHQYAVCGSGSVTGLTFGLRPPPQAEKWIQSVGGDVRWDRPGLSNIIPPGTTSVCPSSPTGPYVSADSLSGSTLTGGVVFTGINPRFLADGSNPRPKANPLGRLVSGNNPFTPSRAGTIKTSYSYVKAAIERGRPDNVRGIFGSVACAESVGPVCNLKSPLAGGIYVGAANESVTLRNSSNTYTFGAGDYVFLIDRDLYIETNLIVPRGSSVIFVVRGEIHVGGGVNRIEGVFSTNSTFIIRNNPSPTPLTVEGNIIANAGLSSGNFTNERDLGAQNAECPAVRIINRPDFILNGPAIIRYSNYLVQEVAPRGN